jgi:hypothetical protein
MIWVNALLAEPGSNFKDFHDLIKEFFVRNETWNCCPIQIRAQAHRGLPELSLHFSIDCLMVSARMDKLAEGPWPPGGRA